ncbi:MAG: MFS transporter [Terriglobia bacterium]
MIPITRNYRWWVVALLFAATIINYVDRQTFSILAKEIQTALHISDLGYSGVVQLFLISYTLAYLVTGRVTDYLGTKIGMVVFIIWWSIAEALTGISRSVSTLGFYRLMVGLGEPGNWTVQAKAIAEWFPPRDRGLAYGICTAGATAGATLAVPMVAFLAASHGWRAPFIVTGLLGLLWVVPWAVWYKSPNIVQETGDVVRDLPAGLFRESLPQESEWQRWKILLGDLNTWLLTLARFLTDPVWYFFLFWFPKYLLSVHSMSLIRVGELAWVVYFAAGMGTIIGGWASGFLVKRGLQPVSARKRIMLISALIVPSSALLAFVPTANWALLISSLVVFAQLAWQVTLGTLIIDLYPQRIVATVFGIIATGSGLGGILSTNAIGHLVTQFSYRPVFVMMAFLHPCALFLLWKIRAPIPVSLRGTDRFPAR